MRCTHVPASGRPPFRGSLVDARGLEYIEKRLLWIVIGQVVQIDTERRVGIRRRRSGRGGAEYDGYRDNREESEYLHALTYSQHVNSDLRFAPVTQSRPPAACAPHTRPACELKRSRSSQAICLRWATRFNC